MEEMESLLRYVFPECYPAHLHLADLREHGIDDEVIANIQNKPDKIVLCFYKNIASLPRRAPRSNRRGKWMLKCHQSERKRQFAETKTFKTLDHCSAQKPCQRNSEKSGASAVNSKINATPEMDRLFSRSKVAKQAMIVRSNQHESSTVPNKNVKLMGSVQSHSSAVSTSTITQSPSKTSTSNLCNNQQHKNQQNRIGRIKLKRPLLTSSLHAYKVNKAD
ncbi:uncharacterized protein LOC143464976 [Clavelina lepadiformis]|uniref:uncharacterized protein LOC143464976 n=1 Tax=Clavelina lepadiformis TaxID=159417 RepID=UPI0040412E97